MPQFFLKINLMYIYIHCCIVVFYYVNIPEFVYPFFCWGTFKLFPVFDCYNILLTKILKSISYVMHMCTSFFSVSI